MKKPELVFVYYNNARQKNILPTKTILRELHHRHSHFRLLSSIQTIQTTSLKIF